MSDGSFGCSGDRRQCRCGCTRGLGERYEAESLDGAAAPPRPRRPGFVKGRWVAHLKGKLAERLMSITPTARAAMREAQIVARREGIDPATVRFTRNVSDHQQRQLTDGIIYAKKKDGKVRVFNVFESKARSDPSDLAIRSQGDLGQIARDFERMKEKPMKIDGEVLQPSRVDVSRQRTAWTVFTPRDVPLRQQQFEEIQARSGFNLRPGLLPLTNDQLWQRAERVANVLSQKKRK